MRIEEVRTGLGARLKERRSEIVQAATTRVDSVSGSDEAPDPEYMEGMRAATSAALDYGIAGLERGEDRSPPVPAELLFQARLAARNRVSLDTVLRRYFAGYALLGDFVLEELEASSSLAGPSLKQVMRDLANLFDRLLLVVSDEYTREAESRSLTSEQRRAERIERLLAGELVDTAELAYDFDAHHLGLILVGPPAEAIWDLAAALDRRLLAVTQRDGAVWAWLGGRQATDPCLLDPLLSDAELEGGALAIGEPGRGFAGWRLSHLQAKASLPIARRSPRRRSRYGDVAILAAALGDDLLATSLRELYLAPLARGRDGGETLRLTLRAYFTAERNISSTAAALAVGRQTVINRLRVIEKRLGYPLSRCAAQVDTALRLHELEHASGLSR